MPVNIYTGNINFPESKTPVGFVGNKAMYIDKTWYNYFRDVYRNTRVGDTALNGLLSNGNLSESGSTVTLLAGSTLSIVGTLKFPGFTAGSVPFINSTNDLAEDNTGLFWDETNARLGVGVNSGLLDDFNVSGTACFVHTAAENDDHAVEILVDAAGFGDVKGLDIVYTTGAITDGDEEAILISIDEFLATGGTVAGLEVVSTEGSSEVFGLECGAVVGPILHLSGTFVDMDVAEVNASDDLANIINPAIDVNIFVADDDTVTIGDIAKFEEIEFILSTTSSGAGIRPTFEYSTGSSTWATFSPTDGTNGMRNNGVLVWRDSDIPLWAVGTGSNYLIRITRTRNSLATTPINSLMQIAAVVEYTWNVDGNVTINGLDVNGLITIDGAAPTDGKLLIGHNGNATYQEGNITAGSAALTVANNAGGIELDVDASAIDHDALLNYVANEHIDWTNATDDFFTTGQMSIGTENETTITIAGSVFNTLYSAHSEASDEFDFLAHRHTDTANLGSQYVLARSRGSGAAETVVVTGDRLATIAVIGHDGTDYAFGARIDFDSTGTIGANSIPTNILFKVAPDGGGSPAVAMTINEDKNVDFTNGIDVTGDVIGTSTGDFNNLDLVTSIEMYNPTNDGNPFIDMGATTSERLRVQTVYAPGTQDLSYVQFLSQTASATNDRGRFLFNVDGTSVLWIDDGGLELIGDIEIEDGSGIRDDSKNEILIFTKVASAVNYLHVTNSAAGNGPILSAAGSETNVDLLLNAKGSGTVVLDDTTSTSAIDFGDASSLEIPNGASPLLNATGEIGLDTSITDHTSLIRYYDGSADFTVIAVPTSNLTTTDGDIVAYNALNNEFEMVAQSGGGLTDVVDDTSPQLGGMLDVNGFTIGDGTRTLIGFQEDGSAVNNVVIENEATGNGPIIRGSGSDTNVDLHLVGKGTGNVILRDGANSTKRISFEIVGSTTGTTTTITTISSVDRAITLPDADDTLVGKATTDTFTNKTFDANGTGNSLSNVDVADLAVGTDGELITWDASGNPATVAVGTATHVLTSNGVGTAPTFQASAGGGTTEQFVAQRIMAGL